MKEGDTHENTHLYSEQNTEIVFSKPIKSTCRASLDIPSLIICIKSIAKFTLSFKEFDELKHNHDRYYTVLREFVPEKCQTEIPARLLELEFYLDKSKRHYNRIQLLDLINHHQM